jgi:DNA mismatch repair protein MutL
MGEIHVLPREVRKLIAAGEVVERPLNVVKELIENSLDAGAKRIEVETLQGGKKLVKVRDNGKGILKEDLPKVIEEGATSKINSVEDIYSLKTLGFRGEALHSIAKVSELTIKSRHFTEETGAEIGVVGGEIAYTKEIGHPVGTTVEVRNLFFNLPARLKFLKSPRTEKKHIYELVAAYALANPEVQFKLEQDGKKVLELNPSTVEDRIREIFELEAPPEHLFAENDLGKAELYYYPNYKSNKFFLFLNGRLIFNKELQTFLKNKLGYRTLAVLFLELPPYTVDVNIHPRKEEVRFIYERKVLELVGSLFKEKVVKPDPLALVLKQTVKPTYGTKKKFQILGQVEASLILAYREGFIYFFDQHLLDETVNYTFTGDDVRACKGSIKAGQKLTEEEMENLLRRWEEVGEPESCPHGRPVYFKLPLSEVYKKLDRKPK